MSYATFNSRGAMTTPFKIKVQMSGVQGERGEDGIDGTVFEEIYLLGNETIPATPAYEPYTSDTPPYDPIYEKHWTRVPSGVTNDLPIEYYSKREFKNNE